MQIIPVIDLKNGHVVHAVRGQRDQYATIDRFSKLTQSNTLDEVVTDFLKLFPFQTFYIADLDAICGTGNHSKTIDSICKRLPNVEFWIDAGQQVDTPIDRLDNQTIVVGTESQTGEPRQLDDHVILSLDFKHGRPCGHPDWFERCDYWPKRVIAMTLLKVGAQTGPDFELLRQLKETHPQNQIVAAGGVRDGNDLSALSGFGIHAALVATALHNGEIDNTFLQKLQAKKYPGKPGYF